MNKSRLEAFSDGMFAIVMTLLILDVRVPEVEVATNAELWQNLLLLWPVVATYFVSFAVLAVFWINHHLIFHLFVKTVDRKLNLINMAYLMFVAFVPFSAHLLGNFHDFPVASVIYGVNIFVVVFLMRSMTNYALHHKELLHEGLVHRTIMQGQIRGRLTLGCYALGIICSYFFIPASIFFYAFPVIFNMIPGTLDLAEKIFRFSLD